MKFPRALLTWILVLIPVAAALAVWLTPLSFVPVPWPDDSAFYFVARELFKWPPRWVMLPQAPFEPTYRIWNFNTMPLYPILIGLGRLVGIDGSFALKLWPLSAWAASGSLIGYVLFRQGLPWALSALVALSLALDPSLRWASVLVRPESLIGLFGAALVLGLTFGFPRRFEKRGLFDPVAALLALGAYCHFNAVHLVFPVVATLLLAGSWRRIVGIGLRTLAYLSPWIGTVLAHPQLFVHQMTTQWRRLAVGNGWLSSVRSAVQGLFQSMGSPDDWDRLVHTAGVAMWVLMIAAILGGLFAPLIRALDTRETSESGPSLVPSAAWVLSSMWLWETKPEVWFTYYVHLAVWCFAGIALLRAWRWYRELESRRRVAPVAATAALVAYSAFVFAVVDVKQLVHLSESDSWRWSTYHDFVGCVDSKLEEIAARPRKSPVFHVWCPTFPDITIELSRRHPDWELTRTNDFWDRAALAVQHGRDAEAVVVTETINQAERNITAPQSQTPGIQSVWMTWNQHFLNQLWRQPGWKPDRFLCQRGRWMGFIFANP